jgi:hypothetical protein
MHFSRSALAGLAIAQGAYAALPPITIKGTKFFFENGTQFFMKGIAYQQDVAAAGGESTADTFLDPLADEAACTRDVPLLQNLQTNTIRVYAIDPEADHTACMELLDAAGIYVIADLGQPRLSINREDPSWDTDLFDRYKAVVDELAQYTNTIGFFAGNEVSNDNRTTGASAYVKAAVRDTKAYIKSKNYRSMGVGYAANDDKDIRVEIAHYFNCGDEDSAIDFWGYNIYSWCQDSSMELSSYDKQVEFFRNYSVPVFFAEYGCNVPDGAEGRIWQETTALYSDEMTDVISGGIVYMYHQEANDYGLVSIDGTKASTMKNYDALATVIAKVDPSGVDADSYTPTNSPQACPDITDTWHVTGDALPPTPDNDLCECMYKSLGCVPAAKLDSEDYGDIFGYICGLEGNLCAGINGNPETGIYGAYGMCTAAQKLGFVLDTYYRSANQAASACDFDGQAVTQRSNAPDTCSAALASASSVNAIAATATAPVAGAAGNGNGDGGSFGVRSADLALGAWVGVVMLAGAGMVLL